MHGQSGRLDTTVANHPAGVGPTRVGFPLRRTDGPKQLPNHLPSSTSLPVARTNATAGVLIAVAKQPGGGQPREDARDLPEILVQWIENVGSVDRPKSSCGWILGGWIIMPVD